MVNPIQLRDFIVANFSLVEIRMLCNNLSIDYEDLSGDSKTMKALELVKYCQRHHTSLDLLAQRTLELSQTKLPKG